MPGVRLRGLNRVAKRLADGRRVVYWYAWKGGPRLEGQPGSPEFIASFNRAVAARKAPRTETLAALVQRFRASPEFNRMADSTKAEWRRWLARIEAADIASLTWAALDDREVRSDLLEWRDTYADRPRTADYGVQVLSRVLSFAEDRGHIRANHLKGVSALHTADRADQIWTPAELDAFCAVASPEVATALRLACVTGLRRGDLIDLRWSEVGDTHIVRRTSKSGKEATIPLTADAKALLAGIRRPRGATHVLLNSRGKPWTGDGLENRIGKAKAAAGVTKRLHDARGTFATRLRHAGLTRDEIAAVMGWEVDRVERLLARYVDQAAFVRRIADKLNGNKGGAETPN
jgi:integrase